MKKIGIFDSGIGGLSIVSKLKNINLDKEIIYIADNAYFPYGSKNEKIVINRSSHLVKKLIELDCEIIIVACNTASSDGNANSESLSGLANSFFYSGAKSLIVTHWSVISKTSVDLMVNTFDFLEESEGDISAALMKSKIKMLKNPNTSHPIYWAPYTLVGRMKTNIR